MRFLSLIVLTVGSWAAQPSAAIKLDQAGYPQSAQKLAAVNWNAPLVFVLAGMLP